MSPVIFYVLEDSCDGRDFGACSCSPEFIRKRHSISSNHMNVWYYTQKKIKIIIIITVNPPSQSLQSVKT